MLSHIVGCDKIKTLRVFCNDYYIAKIAELKLILRCFWFFHGRIVSQILTSLDLSSRLLALPNGFFHNVSNQVFFRIHGVLQRQDAKR